jgi:hypothetical protein
LPACRQTIAGPRGDAPLSIDRQHQRPGAAESEQTQDPAHRRMHFGADHHGDRRRADEAVVVHVPAGGGEHRVPGGGQGREVGHRGAGHERAGAVGRQAERLQRPPQRHLLQRRGCRRHHMERAVLIPGRGQPVRGDGDRQRAAVDEAEVATARHRDRGRRAEAIELLKHLARVAPVLGQGPAEPGQRGDGGGLGGDAAIGERLAVADAASGGVEQQAGGGKRFHPSGSSVILVLHERG